MANSKLDDIQMKVTDLSQRMCQVERQQDVIGEQISNISASLVNINDKFVKERKFLVSHLLGIGIGTTVLITVALVLFHIF